MANAWGGSETANNGATAQHAIPGFNQFMFTRFSPLTWALPSSAGFNPKDGQTRAVLQEAGGLQQSIYHKAGAEYIEYLRSQELPGMGMGPDLIGEYLNALTQLDLKGFRSFFLVSRSLLTFQDLTNINSLLSSVLALESTTPCPYPLLQQLLLILLRTFPKKKK